MLASSNAWLLHHPGGIHCVPCALNTYNPNNGSVSPSECLKCPDHTVTTGTGTPNMQGCLPAPGFYSDDGVIAECPSQFDCDVGAVSVANLSLRAGFWRASPSTTNARRCAVASWCTGGSDAEQCHEGHTGPFCSQCIANHYLSSNLCVVCPDDPAPEILKALLVLLGLVVLAALVGFVIYRCMARAKKRVQAAPLGSSGALQSNESGSRTRLVLVGIKTSPHASAASLHDETPRGSERARNVHKSPPKRRTIKYDKTAERATFWKSAMNKVKVRFHLQCQVALVLCVVSRTHSMPPPADGRLLASDNIIQVHAKCGVARYVPAICVGTLLHFHLVLATDEFLYLMRQFSWINLDFLKLFGSGCVGKRNLYSDLVFVTVAPLCLMACLGIYYVVGRRRAISEEARRAVKSRALWLFYFLTFCIYPTTCEVSSRAHAPRMELEGLIAAWFDGRGDRKRLLPWCVNNLRMAPRS